MMALMGKGFQTPHSVFLKNLEEDRKMLCTLRQQALHQEMAEFIKTDWSIVGSTL
jgi:hypothetical protein